MEQQVNVDIIITGTDAPGHAANNFIELRQANDQRPIVTGRHQNVNDLFLFGILLFVFSTFDLRICVCEM